MDFLISFVQSALEILKYCPETTRSVIPPIDITASNKSVLILSNVSLEYDPAIKLYTKMCPFSWAILFQILTASIVSFSPHKSIIIERDSNTIVLGCNSFNICIIVLLSSPILPGFEMTYFSFEDAPLDGLYASTKNNLFVIESISHPNSLNLAFIISGIVSDNTKTPTPPFLRVP